MHVAVIGDITQGNLDPCPPQVGGHVDVGDKCPHLATGLDHALDDGPPFPGVGSHHYYRHAANLPIVVAYTLCSALTWEESRAWHLMRPLVYYLREDFIPPPLAVGRDVLDFSAGLGDLSQYLVDCEARSVTATRPENDVPGTTGPVEWVGGVTANHLADRLPGSAFDLAAARMVFQFPTWEGDHADPDTMVEQFARVLRPGGRLVVAFHQFRAFEPVPAQGAYPDADQLLEDATGELAPLARLVRYLGLPPREGPMGETGFGLKMPMFVTTLQTHGFDIETADDPEPFTMPLDLGDWNDEEITALGHRVMELKRRYLSNPDQSPYDRPGTVRTMLAELSEMFEFVAWPIARLVARLKD